MAQFIFILEYDISKIKSNELIITAFENKTLYDMYDMILTASNKIPWIVITREQNEKILEALRKRRNGNVSYGETKYKDFFMKHNGEVSGKKSISDWMNRMNDMIKRRVETKDTLPQQASEDNPKKLNNKKRRRGDESPDC